jgi:hypothetical protein
MVATASVLERARSERVERPSWGCSFWAIPKARRRADRARSGGRIVAEALARQSSAPRRMRSSARVRFPPEGDPTLAAPSTAAGA